ncbi:MAG: DUF4166 domain-containing protein [Alphaproteobacteria bacterium]
MPWHEGGGPVHGAGVTDTRLRVLIIGGYGAFGGRLAALLADRAGLTLLVAGRSREKAVTFCAGLAAAARLEPCAFDRNGDVEARIAALRPDIVVDASGPFQAYGADPYRVARAALAAGASYMDLADGSDFVAGIVALDDTAKRRGLFALSGVSSYPVLSFAAVRRLSGDLATVERFATGIAPSPRARLGLGVIRAIASYAGRPVSRLRDGRPSRGFGLIEARRFTVAPPGVRPLASIRFTLVDEPDLRLLPAQRPALRDTWAGAGPTPEILHRGLSALAWLVRLRLLPSLQPLAPLFHFASDALGWGPHRSGMFVAIEGRTVQGETMRRSWHLLAEGADGPMIPSMAVAALVRRILDGVTPAPGARPATDELELADYAPLFAGRRIFGGVRDDGPGTQALPLYPRLLGDAWAALPAPVRALHEAGPLMAATGLATVERGRNPLARLVAALFRFPRAGVDVPVRVEIAAANGRETWRRDFAGRRFASTQEAGTGRFERLVVERFGPFAFGLAPVVETGRLRLVPCRWTLCGLPMPRALVPRGDAFEAVEDGRFAFDVEIALPLIGRVVRYRGRLQQSAAR